MSATSFNVLHHEHLDDLRLLSVRGTDRHDFLQGQLTQDLAILRAKGTALTGWATAKGRLLLTGQLLEWRDTVWITAPAATARQLAERLRRYTLRSDVDIGVSDLAICGLCGTGLERPGEFAGLCLDSLETACAANPDLLLCRVAADPQRLLLVGEQAAVDAATASVDRLPPSPAHWVLSNIRRGIPAILPETLEMFVPQMTNLDLLGGISFDKGCYVGQEIVARTAHLGRIKRRMFRYRCDTSQELRAGAPIHGPGGSAGVIVIAAADTDGQELLAVTRLDAIDAPLYTDEACTHRLTPRPLGYMETAVAADRR